MSSGRFKAPSARWPKKTALEAANTARTWTSFVLLNFSASIDGPSCAAVPLTPDNTFRTANTLDTL